MLKTKSVVVLTLITLTLPFLGCQAPRSADAAKVRTAGQFDPASYAKLAVLVGDDSSSSGGGNDGTVTQIEDEFQMALLNKGYQVVSRSELGNVMREMKLGNSGLTDANDAAKLGRLLNVPAILIVRINGVSGHKRQADLFTEGLVAGGVVVDISIDASARLIGVQSAQVLWQATLQDKTTRTPEDVDSVIRDSIKKLADSFPSKSAK